MISTLLFEPVPTECAAVTSASGAAFACRTESLARLSSPGPSLPAAWMVVPPKLGAMSVIAAVLPLARLAPGPSPPR
jgi:hypothetical protein